MGRKTKEYVCSNCGKKFIGKIMNGMPHRFCSPVCFYQFKKRPKCHRFRRCMHCGRKFYVKRSSHKGVFCSWGCYLAERYNMPRQYRACPTCHGAFVPTETRKITCSSECLKKYLIVKGVQKYAYKATMPPCPTSAYPGTKEKIDVMAQRVAAGQSPFHPDDVTIDNTGLGSFQEQLR